MSSPARKLATARDLIALGEARAEVIHGIIVYKAEPSAEHGDAQLGLGSFLRQHFHRGIGRGGPGGVPERPSGRPVPIRPDFICEVLSESNAATDQVDKFRVYAASGVPFY